MAHTTFAACLFAVFFGLIATCMGSLSVDMDNPPSNVISIPAGSLIIPMDEKQVTSSVFNLKTYGLAINLLYGNVPLYWAIKAGKIKDFPDFTATGQQVFPTTGTQGTFDYSGGPLIILAGYYSQAMGIINSWQGGKHGVIVHKLIATTNIDIRHQIFVKPKVLISNLSGYSSTQTNVLDGAGLTSGVHYVQTSSSGVVSNLNASTCFSFMSEPHFIWTSNVPAYYTALTSFVQSGANFLIQCAGMNSYENYNPGSGRGGFLTQAGIYSDNIQNKVLQYLNPDVVYAQFLGTLDGTNTGVTADFCLNPPSNIGNTQVDWNTEKTWLVNGGFYIVINDPSATKCSNGQTKVIAAICKPAQGNGIGGIVYFLSAHDWSKGGTGYDPGRRMYMNAVLTPSKRDASCGFGFCPPGQPCPPKDACHTCTCSSSNVPVQTAISGCCLSQADCPSCNLCVNKTCLSVSCGSCSQCDANTGSCVPTPNCACTTDNDCLPCYGCDNTGHCATLAADCCTQDSDCPSCEYCDTSHLIYPSKKRDMTKPYYACQPIPNCCAQASDCPSCFTCNSGSCQSTCLPCETCNTNNNTCSAVSGCCATDTDCGTCSVCDLSTRTCSGSCPTCTTCTGSTCVAKSGCCTSDDQCGTCQVCAVTGSNPNTCQTTKTGDVGGCCSGNSDCTTTGTTCSSGTCQLSCKADKDCPTCQQCAAGVCTAIPQCGTNGGGGGGGSSADRLGAAIVNFAMVVLEFVLSLFA